MPGAWPEPFGLVAIESLACGAPVVARRVGALPGIMREGVDGWFGDDVDHLAFQVSRVEGLDRRAIRASVLERTSASRMTDGYVAVYRLCLGPPTGRQAKTRAASFDGAGIDGRRRTVPDARGEELAAGAR